MLDAVPCVYIQRSTALKIRDIIAFPLRAQLQQPFSYSQKWFTHRTALLVKVVTDEDVVGWGEVFCHDAWAAAAGMLEQTFKPLLVGQNPLDIEVIWERLYNWTKDYGQKGVSTAALSGVDIALWDIFGKVTGLPIYQLLGGRFRRSLQPYATGMYVTECADPATALAEEASRYAAQGFRAMKMKVGFGIQEDICYVRSVRNAIGEDIQLMVDANHAYDAASAIRLGRQLEAYNIAWFEEPVSPEDIAGYCRVRRSLDIPIAGGEAEFTRYGFRNLIVQGAVDIVQPDLCITGGISEGRKIAALASTWQTRCLPHVWGTAIGLAAALHFLSALPDTPPSLHPLPLLVEMDQTEHPLRAITHLPHSMREGFIEAPDRPGLGVEVDEDALAHYAAP
ncbi:MAG: mandelate racemase/muconate lactonizing enzyme family protein [Caldilineae bacterium]|nr:MAG: mandelate racemase/muconate lactonizing enzyme family protein [Caldilineae bacterium]